VALTENLFRIVRSALVLYLGKLEGLIRYRKSKKDRQHNDLQNTTQKTKDRATLTSLKPWDDLILNNDNCQPTRQ